ncbi:MAG TPA: TonB family protein [Sulfurimonas sp.]|uniref:energy transducer TonB n=1 Tax=Sulfurimonas sp. TaxID=2022749 RepID=UPI002BC6E90B|nr:TonB family protein [Sulfurimonas sp.]HUH41934.1 TonB family protein [Sulfurimonas sp.]
MIRHSNSLFLSLFIHFLLIILILFISNSYQEDKKEKEQKIALNISTIKFEEKANEQEAVKEEVCADKELKEKPKKVKEEKKEQTIVEKYVKQEIKKEQKIESIAEVKNETLEQNRLFTQIKQDSKPVSQIQTITPAEALKQPDIQEEYSEINKQRILELLRENLYYPMSARKRNITGEVKISFTLDTKAKVCNIHVLESGSDILSRAAIKTIEELSEKFPKPKKEITLTIPINYNLL